MTVRTNEPRPGKLRRLWSGADDASTPRWLSAGAAVVGLPVAAAVTMGTMAVAGGGGVALGGVALAGTSTFAGSVLAVRVGWVLSIP